MANGQKASLHQRWRLGYRDNGSLKKQVERRKKRKKQKKRGPRSLYCSSISARSELEEGGVDDWR